MQEELQIEKYKLGFHVNVLKMRMSSFDTVLNDFLFALIKFYAHIRYLGPSITSIQYYMAL